MLVAETKCQKLAGLAVGCRRIFDLPTWNKKGMGCHHVVKGEELVQGEDLEWFFLLSTAHRFLVSAMFQEGTNKKIRSSIEGLFFAATPFQKSAWLNPLTYNL